MNKLIKSAMMMASVGAMLCVVGCGSDTPDEVALDFFKTMAAGEADMDYLKEHCTEDTAKLFALFGEEAAKEMKGATFSVVDTKIDGDKAVVTIKKNDKTDTVDLVKVDGKWKIAIKK